MATFVRDIALSGAAALGVAVGKHAQRIPPEAVATAEERRLPLFELPWELQFSEITRAILYRLVNEQHMLLTQSLRVHQQLMGLILSGANLNTVAAALSNMLHRPVLVTDPSGTELAQGGGPAISAVHAAVHTVLQRKTTWPPATQGPLVHSFPDLNLAVVPVIVAGKASGYLAAALGHRPLDEIQQLILEHGATAAAICFLQNRAADEAEARLRDDFVWSLATGNLQSQEHALVRGRLLGYDVKRSYVGICGQFDVDKSAQPQETAAIAHRIIDLAHQAARSMRRRLMATFTGRTVTLFFECSDRRAADTFVQRLAAEVRQSLPRLAISWGVGDVRPGYENFQLTYAEARQASQIGFSWKGPGHVTHAHQAGVLRTLLRMAESPESQDTWRRSLAAVFEYEQRKGTNMLDTLEVYLETQGNVSEAARRLHLHRGSVLYRLERVEQLTGCNLSDPRDRFTLELSLRLYRMWRAGRDDGP